MFAWYKPNLIKTNTNWHKYFLGYVHTLSYFLRITIAFMNCKYCELSYTYQNLRFRKFLQFDVTGMQEQCMTTAYPMHVQNTIQKAFFSLYFGKSRKIHFLLHVKFSIIHLVIQSLHWNHRLKLAMKDQLKDDQYVSFVQFIDDVFLEHEIIGTFLTRNAKINFSQQMMSSIQEDTFPNKIFVQRVMSIKQCSGNFMLHIYIY